MHGTLEKKVPRPFGLAAWQPRDVSLEEDALVVVNTKRPADTKRYPFAFVSLQPSAKAPKTKLAFSLLDEDGDVELTLAVETKFAHQRWTRAIQERLDAQKQKEQEPATPTPPPPKVVLGDRTNTKVRLVEAKKPQTPSNEPKKMPSSSPDATLGSFGESGSDLTPAPRAVVGKALSTKKRTPQGASVITYAQGAHAAAVAPAEPPVADESPSAEEKRAAAAEPTASAAKAERARGLVAGDMECAVSEEAVVEEAPKEEKFAALSNLFAARAPPAAAPAPKKTSALEAMLAARAPPPPPAEEPPKEEKFAALSNLFAARAPEPPKEDKHAALSNLFAARAAPPAPPKEEKHAALSNLFAARAPPAPPSPPPPLPEKKSGAFANVAALFACRRAPPSPAPYERFSLTFETGPLGIKFETSERPRVEEVTSDSEHHASLQCGDEVVGIGKTSFFEREDDVERGGDGVFSTDDCYELLADAVEREAFPLVIHLRRRRKAASKPSTPVQEVKKAAPVDDALLAPYLKMKKIGLGAEQAMHKAKQDGKLDENGMAALREALGLKPATPVKKAEEPVDESKLFAAKKKKKVGVPLEKIMATVVGEGCNHATLVAIARAIGAPIPEASSVTQAPQSTTKNIHWDGLSSPSIQRRKGSLWGRSGRRKRESLGARAESLFTENQAASEMLEEMFALAPAPKKNTKPTGEKEVQLLEGTKAQNLEITLANLRDVKPWPVTEDESSSDSIVLGLNDCRNLCADAPGLVRALVATGLGTGLATKKLLNSNDTERCAPPDVLRRLVENMPTEEECRKVAESAAKTPDAKFNKATAFVVAAHAFGLQRFKACLNGAATCGEAPSELEACVEAAQTASQACRLAREEPMLRAACHAALALGNRLNQGSRRGSAVAVRLVDLEKLSQTKGKGGKTAMDYLARVLEDDAFDREEGLDGAEIDRALRVIAPKLKAGAENAIAEKTLEVKQREMNALNALDAFVKSVPKKKKTVDDEAVAAFVRNVPEASKQTRDALAAAKKALDEMNQEQKLLREYVGDAAMQIPEILESIASFSSKLVASRTALMKELGSSSRRSSCTEVPSRQSSAA